MSARIEVRMPVAVKPGAWPKLETSKATRRLWDEVAHQGEDGADVCTYRHHDEPHPATIRLTPDPDLELVHAGTAHVDVMTVCRCCAYEAGHLYEEMRGQCRTSGEVGVELRQSDGRWIS
ncbi:hypothetical protein [Amycolatopsis lurida]|uniref:hypothetical protein n=1 Tax=Amycolatopsis lurida TaxID=31959 RepID=UPI003652AA5D